MKKFKAIITSDPTVSPKQNQKLVRVNLPFSITIEIDKNNQIHDIHPRTAGDVDLFSKYHGRTCNWALNLVNEYETL